MYLYSSKIKNQDVLQSFTSEGELKGFFRDLMAVSIFYWRCRNMDADLFDLYYELEDHWFNFDDFLRHTRCRTFGESYKSIIHTAIHVHKLSKDGFFTVEEDLRSKIIIALTSFENIGIRACDFDFNMGL